MRIFVTSRGRADRQTTINLMPERAREHTTLVVPFDELATYLRKIGGKVASIIARPPDVTGLSACRQWIQDNPGIEMPDNKYVLLDDDLRFFVRKQRGDWHLRNQEPAEIDTFFEQIKADLDKYAHVGASFRQANHTNLSDYALCKRQFLLLAYRRDVIAKHGLRFDRLPLMSDFDMTLQLLRAGYPNKVWFQYAVGQDGSNMKGGCSTYRTPEMMAEAATGLANLHAPFVKTVPKVTKGRWFGENSERLDVRVQWVKAHDSAGKTIYLD